MLENIEIEKIIQDIDSGLTDYTIGKKYKHSHNTIANIRKEHEAVDAGENQEEAKKQEVHFDNPINKVRAIPKAIDDLIKTEQLKADDRAEWEKRIEDIREVLRKEVDDRIAGEREDATEKRDGEWRGYLKKNYNKKEIAANLRSILKERDTTIEDLTETIEEKDNLNTNLSNKNIDLNNDNTALRKTNADLREHIDKYLDDAGRREKNACVREQDRLKQMESDFDSACTEKRNKLEQEKSSLDRYISRLSNWRSELVQRDEYQDECSKELDKIRKLLDDQEDKQRIERKEITQEQNKRDKKLSKIQKLLDDQVVKQQIKATELEQKKYELKQKGDAIAAVKKDLMDFAGEIGQEFSELGRLKQEIERNKHFLFLTGEHEKALERISLS